MNTLLPILQYFYGIITLAFFLFCMLPFVVELFLCACLLAVALLLLHTTCQRCLEQVLIPFGINTLAFFRIRILFYVVKLFLFAFALVVAPVLSHITYQWCLEQVLILTSYTIGLLYSFNLLYSHYYNTHQNNSITTTHRLFTDLNGSS